MPCIRPCSPVCLALVVACAALLSSSPAVAQEKEKRFRIPPPPPPKKVVRDIRGFLHRVASGVKDASKQTWSAIRERFDEDEPKTPRTAARPRPKKPPSQDDQSFARSKDAVPYRYDDADTQPEIVPGGGMPPVNLSSRDAAKPAPSTSGRPFAAPESSSGLPEGSTATPRALGPAETSIEFARPVPGKRGLVYPPGASQINEHMVDVGGFQTGQIVRDPRTGKLFRVP